MKLNLISFSDIRGGAAIAAYKHYKILNDSFAVKYIVAEKRTLEPDIVGPSKCSYFSHLVLRVVSFIFLKLQRSENTAKHSLNMFSSKHVINSIDDDADIVHFHWINNDTISLEQLNLLLDDNRIFIFSLHDDWLFCGAEHYSLVSNRFISGYSTPKNKTLGIDLNRWVYKRKERLKAKFRERNVIFTAPSKWMAKRAESSNLLKGIEVKYLPNVIDTNIFRPYATEVSRSFFSIPENKFVICFGAVGGTANHLKGYDLLAHALNLLQEDIRVDMIHLVIFGGEKKADKKFLNFDVTYTGHVSDSTVLAQIYSAADVVVVPSRIESFGQVAAESLSCETPVVCFDNSAVAEIVDDGISGFTAKAFDARDLKNKIVKMLNLSNSERTLLGRNGRKKICENYSPKIVFHHLCEIYRMSRLRKGFLK
ncbi:hypothetical protein C9J48_27000 [Photobacterium profundum]|uniref:Putative glycosyl transferase n=1 Tax=Photobacterium profundum 3TCK TaxID=314280 RepID=Q1Z8A5_9GAMM|nr:glycosyltransferase [Photobacterium profundum]EAS44608.1 putative glycosyl transferase [Photobacterium profundum 3TCK]PSV57055.1 hypothetical protein C9J48_27000 [Photobacterium profundum]